MRRLTSIVSGARPGAQRGALAAAVELGIGYGGWVPAGTVVDPIYRDRVRASSSGSSIMAMRLNVQDSDGTLIVSFARTLAGSAAVIDGIVDGQRKASLHVVLPAGGESGMPDAIMTEILEWLDEARIGVLNVAGPLEDEEPGIEQATRDLLVWVLEDAAADVAPSDAAIQEVRAIAEQHLAPLGSAHNPGTTCAGCGRLVPWHTWCALHQACGDCADRMGALADGDAT